MTREARRGDTHAIERARSETTSRALPEPARRTSPSTGGAAGPDRLLALQRTAGNRSVARVLARQPGLRTNAARPAGSSAQPRPVSAPAAGGPVPDHGVLEELEADERPLQQVARTVRRLMRYTGSDAAAYARKWAKKTNSSYPRFGNDCTNFVSQALLAGGWGMTGGSCGDRKDNDVWWYGSSKCWYPGVRASYTWAGAHNLSKFMAASGRATHANHVKDLEIGDVLQMQFDGDDNIHHTMIVTDKTADDTFLSYHTSDHLDEPFWAPGGIFDRYPTASYYGWKL